MAPIPITRAEYEAKFGGVAAPAATPIPISRADFEAKFSPAAASVPSIWSDPIDALTSYDWWTTRPDGSRSGVVGPVLAAGQGLTLGTLDEVAAGGNALLDRIFSGVPLSEAYDQRLEQTRGVLKDYQETSPGQAFALELLGGANLPIKSAIGEKTGLVAKTAQAAKEGGTLGALYGYGTGEGGALERAKDAAIGGGVGAGAGAVLTPVVEGSIRGAQWLADKAVELGITPKALVDDLANNLFSGAASSERGSWSPRPTGEGYTAAELAVARELKNTAPEKIAGALDEMRSAVGDDIPLFLPEAVESPKVFRNARFIANYEPSMEMAGRAIKDRADDAAARVVGALDSVSTDVDTFSGASRFVGAADDIIKAAETRREEIAKPLYGAAYSEMPEINNPALTELLDKDKVLQKAINSVKQTANNADLPDNSTELLVKARAEIGNLIESAKAQGLGRKARDLTDTYGRLNDILHDGSKNPLKVADEAYQVASKGIEALNDTFLSNLQRISPDKIQNVGQIFSLPAQRIEQLKDTFVAAGKEAEWNAGVRSFLQNSIEGTTDGRNFTLKLTGNSIARDKLRAALGDSYDDIARRLDLENRMFDGRNRYNAGSTTVGNLNEQQQFGKETTALAKGVVDGKVREVLAKLFSDDIPDELAQGIAEIYFNPRAGADTLGRIQPLLDAYGKNKSVADAVSALGGLATSRGAAVGREELESLSGLSRQARPKANSAEPQRTGSKTEGSSSKPATPQEQAKNPATDQDRSSGTQLKNGGKIQPTYTDNDNLFNDLFERADMRNVKDVEAEIDRDSYLSALYEAESGRNPQAKNPKSTASGGFQFIKRTAASLGLKDPFDLDESLTAVRKLTDEHKRLFGDDPAVLYSAHYLGSTLLRKVQRGATLTAKEQGIVDSLVQKALPRFMRIYNKVTKTSSGGGQVEA